MGVAGLHAWLRAHFASCFSFDHRWQHAEEIDVGERPEGVGVDLGGELHRLCQSATHELFFVQHLYERLDEILARLRPLHTVVLALDGPGPAAKWAEQRRRRMRGRGGNKRNERSCIDMLQLTPGTVREALCHYACSRLLTPSLHHNLRFVISPATAPGEAELKLAEVLSSVSPAEGRSTGKRKHHVIISDDSDVMLIGMCMACTHPVDVSVVRRSGSPTPYGGGPDQDAFVQFSTAAFFARLRRSFPRDPPERIAVDFVFLVLLTGNDYLPRLSKAKLDNLWRTYRALKGADREEMEEGEERPAEYAGRYLYDASNHAIDPSFLATFLLRNPSLFPSGQPTPAESKAVEHDRDEAEDEDDPKEEEEEEKEREDKSPRNAKPLGRELSRPSAEEFIRGLEWNMRMYLDFRCPDYDYFYPSWDAPSPTALVERLHLMERRSRSRKRDRYSSMPARSTSQDGRVGGWPLSSLPLLPHQFCVALMPPWGKEYIPDALQQHCEIEDSESSALFMNPADLIESRLLLVRGLEAYGAATPSSASSIASLFTATEARTLSFSSHLFYERRERREQLPASAGAVKPKAERKSKEKERTKRKRPVDEFGRDVEWRDRKRTKAKGKVVAVAPEEKRHRRKMKGKHKAGDEDSESGSAPATRADVQTQHTEELHGSMDSDGFNIETPFGATALSPGELALLRHGTIHTIRK